jgi:hypothetical protein
MKAAASTLKLFIVITLTHTVINYVFVLFNLGTKTVGHFLVLIKQSHTNGQVAQKITNYDDLKKKS